MNPRVGFVGWNPFQFIHSLAVAKAMPGSTMVIERRRDAVKEFSEELLTSSTVPVVIWDRNAMAELDGIFDVVVCQTLFNGIEHFSRSKVAMLQYGLAKEPHNHGAWRSFADLTLVYGRYTAEKMSCFCPVEQVGCPRFDEWNTPALRARAERRYAHLVDPTVKTVLYVPTWGELSTQELFLAEVLELSSRYNVLIKVHHNTDLLEHHRKGLLAERRVHHMGANDDLLELLVFADVVLSDYSGAIFDALYCEKPVILLQQRSEERFGDKLDAHSLEYAARDRIGPVVELPSALRPTVEAVLGGATSYRDANAQLVRELFVPGHMATERAAQALCALARGESPAPTQMQAYVREELRRARLERTYSPSKARERDGAKPNKPPSAQVTR